MNNIIAEKNLQISLSMSTVNPCTIVLSKTLAHGNIQNEIRQVDGSSYTIKKRECGISIAGLKQRKPFL